MLFLVCESLLFDVLLFLKDPEMDDPTTGIDDDTGHLDTGKDGHLDNDQDHSTSNEGVKGGHMGQSDSTSDDDDESDNDDDKDKGDESRTEIKDKL